MNIVQTIAAELGIKDWQVEAVIKLIDEGNTIPFIARYRKEAHGTLNDEQLRSLDERLRYLRALEERRGVILASIEEQGSLTQELKKQIETANAQAAEKEKEYQAKLDDLEFSGLLDTAIAGAKAKNAKAVKALLDIDTLKGSKNRSEDIKAALEAVAKDNDYLFDSGSSQSSGTGNTGTTGTHGGNNNVPPTVSDADARAVMGLPPENK